MKRIKKKHIIVLSTLLIVYLILSYYFAGLLIAGRSAPVPKEVTINGFNSNSIQVITEDSLMIQVWHFENYQNKAVILLAGLGGNRQHMLQRAKLYLNEGYNVFIPDLRASGVSVGEYVSFGWHERKDLKALYTIVDALGYEEIGVHGISLGAATITYGLEQGLEYDYAILESCYDNIDQAFSNRMWNLNLPPQLFIATKWFVELRLDLDRSDLYPENWVKQLTCPTMVICGDQEVQLKEEESKKLYNNIKSKDKYLKIYGGAKHQDLYQYDPTKYQRDWQAFIKNH